jgi:hypothetical protein
VLCRSMPDCCERCFWLQVRLGWKLPFQIFPGIFSSLDSYSKKIVAAHIHELGRVPSWLPVGSPIPVPHWSKFSHTDPVSRIRLVGAPDEMLRLPNGRLSILDYKTARITNHQDALAPMYEAQLNAYAWLAERLAMGTAEQLALVYCEPHTELDNEDLLALTDAGGFSMRFQTTLVPVTLTPERIPSLLARARDILDRINPGCGHPGCQDCARVAALMGEECCAGPPPALPPSPPGGKPRTGSADCRSARTG